MSYCHRPISCASSFVSNFSETTMPRVDIWYEALSSGPLPSCLNGCPGVQNGPAGEWGGGGGGEGSKTFRCLKFGMWCCLVVLH